MSNAEKLPDGVDESVVASVLYRPGQAPLSVPVMEAGRHLGEPGGLVWVGLKEPDPAMLRQLGEKLGFSPKAIEEVIEPHRRPKVADYESVTQIVAITFKIDGTRPSFGETQILIGKGFLLTIRRGASSPYRELRERLESSPDILARGSDYVASALLDLLVDRYMAALDKLEAGVEKIEQQFLLGGSRGIDVHALYRQRRDLLRIHTLISPMAEICRRLSHVEMSNVDRKARSYFGEIADRVLRANEFITSQREALAFAFEASLMLGQSQQTDITKRLAAWAAILAVPTAIAGIYGMNFQFMPELHWTYGYPLVLGVTAAICAVLFWRFRKSGWL